MEGVRLPSLPTMRAGIREVYPEVKDPMIRRSNLPYFHSNPEAFTGKQRDHIVLGEAKILIALKEQGALKVISARIDQILADSKERMGY